MKATATIRQLPPILIDQIAAGEVVERPASVVKELIENALDAGAGRIDVRMEEGGRTLIDVRDDGSGIASDELALAIAPHATSKIADAEDLAAIATMGFRGEALASISSVSRMTVRSRPADADAAAVIEVNGGVPEPIRPDAGPAGTTVTVRDLFFNVPARASFMKSARTEGTRIAETMRHLALAHPEIGFSLRHGGDVKLDLPMKQTVEARVAAILGREFREQLLPLDHVEGGVTVRGVIARPEAAKATARAIRIVLNGRIISDRLIQHAIREGFRGLLDMHRWPVAVVYLGIDPSEVDVNVHPQKSEVRFRNGQATHAAVRHAIKSSLAAAQLTPSVDLTRSPVMIDVAPPAAAPRVISTPTSTTMPPPSAAYRPSSHSSPPRESVGWDAIRLVCDVLQIENAFLIVPEGDGVLIIDQHALHERVMFETLLARVTAGTMETQPLLTPAVVPVEPAHAETLDSLDPLLKRIGIDARMFGPASIGIHAAPTLLFSRRVDPGTFVAELLERAHDRGLPSGEEAALHEVLDMMACKAAIKAGDKLSRPEIEDLLRMRETVERSSNCPHGRPTTLRLTRADLERQFGRA